MSQARISRIATSLFCCLFAASVLGRAVHAQQPLEASVAIQFAGNQGAQVAEYSCDISIEVATAPQFSEKGKVKGIAQLRNARGRVWSKGSKRSLFSRSVLTCRSDAIGTVALQHYSKAKKIRLSRVGPLRMLKFLSFSMSTQGIGDGSRVIVTNSERDLFVILAFDGCRRSDATQCEIESPGTARILLQLDGKVTRPSPTPTQTLLQTPTPTATPLGRRSIIVAQGYLGRTTISCDDGKSWVANRSWDTEGDEMVCGHKEAMRCDGSCWQKSTNGGCTFQQSCDCGHGAVVGKGLAYGNSTFVANYGWGGPGKVMISRNGVDWATSRAHAYADYGGLDYGAGKFVLSTRSPLTSSDGVQWSDGGPADFRDSNNTILWSVRSFKFLNYLQGRFVAVAEAPGRDMLVSKDSGMSWSRPSVLPADCALGLNVYGSIAYGNGIAVAIGPDGKACRSADGGETWSSSIFSNTPTYSHTVWNGNQFVTWSNWFDGYYRYTSPDGITWTKQKMLTEVNIATVMVSSQGTYIASNDHWTGHERQQFLRSKDGLTWEILPAGSFVPSHAILRFAEGEADGSQVCPGQ